MKKIITWLILSIICTAAFAFPRPSQIEDALAAKNYAEARGMVAEVLREKPESARAHLLNAYLLVHADHNRAAANTELQTAASLDKRGDVKSSPLFGRVVAEIDAAAPAHAVVAAPLPLPDPQPVKDDFPWLAVILVLSVAAVGIYLVIRRRYEYDKGTVSFTIYKTDALQPAQPAPTHSSMPPSGVAPQTATPAPRASTVVHEHHYQSAPAAAPQSMGAFGTVASVAGGVMAGNALSAALMGQRATSSFDEYRARRQREAEEDDERRRRDSFLYSSSNDSSPVSTSSERSSFSSSSSGSDSWSSGSSYDSGSSSDWGSSSSFDSGSSSSSDW
jgi:hypothetical protein